MKNQCVVVENNGKKVYAKPIIEVVSIDSESILSGSGVQTESYEEGVFTWG